MNIPPTSSLPNVEMWEQLPTSASGVKLVANRERDALAGPGKEDLLVGRANVAGNFGVNRRKNGLRVPLERNTGSSSRPEQKQQKRDAGLPAVHSFSHVSAHSNSGTLLESPGLGESVRFALEFQGPQE